MAKAPKKDAMDDASSGPPRSDGHLCFARGVLGGTGGLSRIQPSDAGPGDWEFFVDPSGTTMARASVGVPIAHTRQPSQLCLTGAYQVAEACRSLQCKVPVPTMALLIERGDVEKRAKADKTAQAPKAQPPHFVVCQRDKGAESYAVVGQPHRNLDDALATEGQRRYFIMEVPTNQVLYRWDRDIEEWVEK